MSTTELVHFRLIQMPCKCEALVCWINPRLPNYCPECGDKVYLKLRFERADRILVSDTEATLKIQDENYARVAS